MQVNATEPVSNHLSVDAVIATRNRTDALAISIPLLLAQSRPPQSLIIIDSSDDHTPVRDTVMAAVKGWAGRVIIEHSPPGLPLQRNRGLVHVTAPLVVFPDDDSLFCPGSLEAMLAIYERDTEGQIAGVAARETNTPPEGSLSGAAYQRSDEHQRQAASASLRYRLERRLVSANPLRALGLHFLQRRTVPEWLASHDAVAIEFMTGFRMSFRTPAIRAVGFDETLEGHALGEDIDASFGVARHGLLVGAHRAEVFHHKFPSGRGNTYSQGAIGVLNRTYVLRKHVLDGQVERSERRRVLFRLSIYIGLRLLAAMGRLFAQDGRARCRGILAALAPSWRLWKTPRQDLSARYKHELKALVV